MYVELGYYHMNRHVCLLSEKSYLDIATISMLMINIINNNKA